jgi:CHAT domain-containing protein
LRTYFSKVWLTLFLSAFVIAAVALFSSKYIGLYLSHTASPQAPKEKILQNAQASKDPDALMRGANQRSWLVNWPEAGPLYGRAETLFKERGDKRDEIYARVGRLRAQSETMSYVDVSRMIGRELDDPIVKNDPELRLWCLAQKGYTDIEINRTATKWDWTEARKIAKSLGKTQWAARSTGELGIIAFLEGDTRRAAKMVGGALLSAMASGDVGGQVRYLEMLGNAFNTVGRYEEALSFFNRAIDLTRETPYAGFPYMAFEGKAQALAGQQKFEDARQNLNLALRAAEENEKFGQQSQIFIQLGELELGTEYKEQAITFLKQAGQLGQQHAFFRMAAQAFFDLANIYGERGDLTSAEQFASMGVDASRQIGDRYYLPRDLTALAGLKAREGDVARANALYEQAEDIIDGMLVNLDEPYWSSSLAGAMSKTYIDHFQLLAQIGNVPEALGLLDRVRGRTVAALLENRVSFRKDESAEARALDASVSELQVRLMRSSDLQEREKLKEQLFEVERQLTWTAGDHGVSRHQWLERPAALRTIQAILSPDELVLEYVLAEPHAYCLWITRKRAGLAELAAGRERIDVLTRSYLNTIGAERDDPRLAKELYTILLGPVTEEATHDRLIVAPDGPLYFLPFDTLRDGNGSLLVESRTISYVPAATVLEILRTAKDGQQASRSFLGVGDVPYQDHGNASAELPPLEGIEQALLRGLSDVSGSSFYDLPQTREEVIDSNKILGNDGVILLGPRATAAAFESEPLEDFRIVHLAVHGFADPHFPERSGLVLGAGPKKGEDGLLQIPEIMQLHFHAALVTLSACDTGIGKLEGEEGPTNLAEAFLVSGAKAVMASMWSVEDTYTLALMKRFYTHIAEGQDKAKALRTAKLDVLAEYGDQLPPFYWGAFVLIGDGGSPISLRQQ